VLVPRESLLGFAITSRQAHVEKVPANPAAGEVASSQQQLHHRDIVELLPTSKTRVDFVDCGENLG
jgi:hypothetical protein